MESKKTVKHTVRIEHKLLIQAQKILGLSDIKLPYCVIADLALRKFIQEHKLEDE